MVKKAKRVNAMNAKIISLTALFVSLVCLVSCSGKDQAGDGKAQAGNQAQAGAGSAALPAVDPDTGYPRQLTLDLGDNIFMKLTLIPSRTFLMGRLDNPNKPTPDFDEHQHEVRISKPFYLGVYQVTQAQYQQVMGRNPSAFVDPKNPAARASWPVERVSWDDAVEFCHRMSEITGRRVSLPTEAQWELACRAGTQTMFSFGNSLAEFHQYGNYCDLSNTDDLPHQDKAHSDGADKTAKVGSYKPNAWGLYDMHGNVLEWCADWYGERYPATPQVDPEGPKSGTLKVLRGGHWKNAAIFAHSAHRSQGPPNSRMEYIGFRVTVVADESDLTRKVEAPDTAVASSDGAGAGVTVSPNHDKVMLMDLGDGLAMKLMKIEPGTFKMGSPETEAHRRDDETQHEVTIGKPFLIGVSQVTQEQYELLMGKNPSAFKDPQNPVETVSWDDAVEFCRVMSEKTGRKVHLPTEAQWEYACRAGTTTPFNTGTTIDAGLVNYNGRYVYGNGKVGENRQTTTLAEGFFANDFGLFDMHGNVQEWCADWYSEGYYRTPEAKKDPTGPATGSFRVVRGGSWDRGPTDCRSAHRDSNPPTYRANYIGFRVVVEME